MTVRLAIPDMISPSYFPVIAAVELGLLADRGIDADLELVFPVTDTYAQLRDGELDYVGGAAHAPLYAFDRWQGCTLLGALSQHMYWFLVVRPDLEVTDEPLEAIRGQRIGAAPGPVDGLVQMLRDVGMDPDTDVAIGPVPAAAGGGASFGVSAAEALERGEIDGFWANGMGAEVAVRRGTGKLILDARRGGGPKGSRDLTFAALVTTQQRLDRDPDEVRAVLGAVIDAQRALVAQPELATKAAAARFPEYETSLIASLIERDAPYYDPTITHEKVRALNRFAAGLGLLDDADVPVEDVLALSLETEWQR